MELTPGETQNPGAEQAQDLDEYINDPRFHQAFTLPPGPGQPEPFQLTYSDYGYRNPSDPEQENILLFCAPLMSSRLLHIGKDKLAKKYRVRIIYTDRSGMGDMTEVASAGLRLETWMTAVKALLQHLDIAAHRVSLACHSAGTLYALHALLHLDRGAPAPDGGRKARPYYAAFCTPWVHPSHSHVTSLRLASTLPPAVLGFADVVARPFVASSLAWDSLFGAAKSGGGQQQQQARRGEDPAADPAMVAFEERLQPRIINRVYAGSVRCIGQEIVLLMKKSEGGGAWGDWGDLDRYVPMLAAQVAEKAAAAAAAGGDAEPSVQLEIETFFAESDNMIGETAGPKWWDECWKPENRGERIHYQSHVLEGTDHDTILGLRYGVMERIFRKISGFGEEST